MDVKMQHPTNLHMAPSRDAKGRLPFYPIHISPLKKMNDATKS